MTPTAGPAKMPASNWPDLPAIIPPAFTRPSARPPDGRPPAGLLDVSLPWETLTGTSPAPGHLGRIGPVTATQARHLAAIAAADPDAEWRIIITTGAGHALAVTRIPRPRPPGGHPPGPGPGKAHGARTGSAEEPGERTGTSTGTGLVGRVTLTIREDTLTHPPPWPEPGQNRSGVRRARSSASPCAPPPAPPPAPAPRWPPTPPPAGLRPHHRQPRLPAPAPAQGIHHRAGSHLPLPPLPPARLARRPRPHHPVRQRRTNLPLQPRRPVPQPPLLKHHPDWQLAQTTPGHFTWTTPSGRTHTTTPDTHPL